MRFLFSIEKSIGSVIFRRKENGEKEFLILHYPNGHWDFAKGHVEKGETEYFTLLREIAEETGITNLTIIPKFKRSIRYFYRAVGDEALERIHEKKSLNIMKKLVYYLVEVRAKKIVISSEHVGYGWFDGEQALSRITYSGARSIFIKANDFMKKYKI
ncbi:MAG TPA: diadenosine tetraphosphate hydrolase [Candidatus Moranbacteria bacterium]|nr:diadenosine tetraphosphate hydrolase [Candidatus Moranbacteria bacterium]